MLFSVVMIVFSEPSAPIERGFDVKIVRHRFRRVQFAIVPDVHCDIEAGGLEIRCIVAILMSWRSLGAGEKIPSGQNGRFC
jgi:hypothetical protein